MEINKSEHKTLDILNEIVENTKAFGILALLDSDQRSNFRGLSTNMEEDKQCGSTGTVSKGP